jgi:hypothetical protein
MKGVILRIAPQVHIVDITHQVPPQDVRRATAILDDIVPYYPSDAIHVVVVDPGVGSQRRPIVICGTQGVFVGPDNGVFSHTIVHAKTVGVTLTTWHLDNPAYWLPTVSRTFHGRDIFAPVAAYLAIGVPCASLGTPIDNPMTLPVSPPQRLPSGRIRGQIIAIDHFGNLISDVPAAWLAGKRWHFQIASQWVDGLSETYADAAPGQMLALIGSSGKLEIAVRNGSAAQQLGVQPGEPIEAMAHDIKRNT